MVYLVTIQWADDDSSYDVYITDEQTTPDGYHDDDIFYYGITPVAGDVFEGEFKILKVKEI